MGHIKYTIGNYMKKINNYSKEDYQVNLTSPDPSGARIHIYSYCNSYWFKGNHVKIQRVDSPYSIYSLNLSGFLETTNLESGEVFRYTPGTFTITKVNSGDFIAKVGRDKPVIRKFILVRRNILHDIIIDRMFQTPAYFKLQNINAVELIMDKFHTEMSAERDINNACLSGLFFQLLNELHIQLQKNDYPECLQKALHYISYAFDKRDLNRDKIASVAGVSIRTLNNLFPKHLRTSFFNYVINLRLEQVCRMLEFSNMPISEIAEKCGFTTPNFMAREFRQKYNRTPRDYRAQHRFQH